MDKEDFLLVAMKLLQSYIDLDIQQAKDVLELMGVTKDEIPSVIYTIHNMSLGYV